MAAASADARVVCAAACDAACAEGDAACAEGDAEGDAECSEDEEECSEDDEEGGGAIALVELDAEAQRLYRILRR